MAAATVKGYKGMGMEGGIAKWYATTTRRDMDEFKSLARRVAFEIPRRAAVLEIAPGPGYFSIELAKIGDYKITGLDISRTFVDIARRNAAEAKVNIEFRQGNASAMPFVDQSFDFLLCRAAFKNFTEPQRAIQEMSRVLKPGGEGWIIDLRPDAPMKAIGRYTRTMDQGWFGSQFMKLTFYFLKRRAHTRAEFQQYLSKAQFASTGIHEEEIGFEVRMRR